jgi:hypothetical protein
MDNTALADQGNRVGLARSESQRCRGMSAPRERRALRIPPPGRRRRRCCQRPGPRRRQPRRCAAGTGTKALRAAVGRVDGPGTPLNMLLLGADHGTCARAGPAPGVRGGRRPQPGGYTQVLGVGDADPGVVARPQCGSGGVPGRRGRTTPPRGCGCSRCRPPCPQTAASPHAAPPTAAQPCRGLLG